jgi:hypothetical protein
MNICKGVHRLLPLKNATLSLLPRLLGKSYPRSESQSTVLVHSHIIGILRILFCLHLFSARFARVRFGLEDER